MHEPPGLLCCFSFVQRIRLVDTTSGGVSTMYDGSTASSPPIPWGVWAGLLPAAAGQTPTLAVILTDTVADVVSRHVSLNVAATIAGRAFNYLDGDVASATFADPQGIAVTWNNIIYVSGKFVSH